MGRVIGPINQQDWNLLSDLLTVINTDKDKAKFRDTLKKHRDLYDYVKERYI